MYVSLGLLWLSFKIIYGEIISCPIGGMKSDLDCKVVNQESVLNKFYITRNINNSFERFDSPYNKIEESLLTDKSRMQGLLYNELTFKRFRLTSNVCCYKTCYGCYGTLNVTSAHDGMFIELEPSSGDKNQNKHYATFKKSLILDDTVPMEQLWSDVLETGTDTYRIKFHHYIDINIYKYTEKKSSKFYKEYMIFIQSYYNAASTYYFSRNYGFALAVVTEGINFFQLVQANLYSNNQTQNHNVDIWNLLLLTLQLDILIIQKESNFEQNTIYTKNNYLNITTNNISNLVLKINENNKLMINPFPSSAVLLFRRHFLGDVDNNIIIQLNIVDWLKLLTNLDDDILYRKNISMYKFLVLAVNVNSEKNEKLSNIFKAIQRPVLCIEDRLLNYKATQFALDLVTPCIDDNENKDELCKTFTEYKTGIEFTISYKLSILHNINEYLINKLRKELKEENHIIDQNVLHSIVSAVLDINIKSNLYTTYISYAEEAIKLLNEYIKVHEKTLNKYEQTKSENLKKRGQDKPNCQIDKIQNIVHNLFIANKWLMELYLVLSNNSLYNFKTWNFYVSKVRAQKMAFKFKELFSNENLVKDEHFIYLGAKEESKRQVPCSNWEPSNRPGGCVNKYVYEAILQYCSPTTMAKENNILKQLIVLKDNSKSPYINRIEIFTIIFRYLWKRKQDYVAMYTSIKSAITEIVVTPEDRLRNLEAHELFTMFLMEKNEVGVELARVLGIGPVYNTFLINPDIRYENNITLKDFWDEEDGDNNMDINNAL